MTGTGKAMSQRSRAENAIGDINEALTILRRLNRSKLRQDVKADLQAIETVLSKWDWDDERVSVDDD